MRLPVEPAGSSPVYHLFVIRSHQREAIREALLQKKSGAESIIRCRCICSPRAAGLGYQAGDFPASERIADTALSLPMHPALTIAEVDRVAEAVRDTMKKESSLFAGGHRPDTATCEPPPTCGG